MREILFRGNKVANGEWVEGYYNYISEGEGTYDREQHFIQTEYKGRFGMCWEVNPDTVGQFTGMYDKNGRKIFEGDIVRTKFGRLCIVRWFSSPMYSCWDLKAIETTSNLAFPRPVYTDLYKKDNLEIVGNIYDNPELMEEKK